MKIAIDISQIAYGTGVSVYTENLVRTLVKNYPDIHWVLFAGVFRNKKNIQMAQSKIFNILDNKEATNYINKEFQKEIKSINQNTNCNELKSYLGMIVELPVIDRTDWSEL